MLKKFLLGLVGIFVAYVAVVWSGVLPRNTEAQEQALAVLNQPYQYAHGKQNAFKHVWLAPYDIPAAEIDAAYALELQNYNAAAKAGTSATYQSHLNKTYARQELPGKRLCPRGPNSCLAFVRENPDESRKTAAEFSAYRLRTEKLRDADHLANALDFSFATPLPPLAGISGLQTLSAAVDFNDGKTDQALDAVCRNYKVWRQLRSHNDILVVDMVGVSFGNDQLNLLADMLAELPADHPLPASCSTALAPLAANEIDQCDIARGEMKTMSGAFAYAREAGIASVEFGQSGFFDSLVSSLINVRASAARLAPHIAILCSGQPAAPADFEIGLAERLFDPVGSYYTELAMPNYSEYRKRAMDFAGVLQMMRTLVWLRTQTDLETAGDLQPDDLKMSDHKLVIDKTAKTLSIELLAPRHDDPSKWTLPMAGSRLKPVTANQ